MQKSEESQDFQQIFHWSYSTGIDGSSLMDSTHMYERWEKHGSFGCFVGERVQRNIPCGDVYHLLVHLNDHNGTLMRCGVCGTRRVCKKIEEK